MRWMNWGRNVRWEPAGVARPRTVEEAAETVRVHPRVKPVGSLHSFSGLVRTDGITLVTDRLPRDVTWAGQDPVLQAPRVRCAGHMEVWRAMRRMDLLGFALHNSGSNIRPSVLGSVATGVHGTGVHWGSIAHPDMLRAVEGVDGQGQAFRRDASNPEHASDLRALRANLGGLGLLTAVELAARPPYRLRLDARQGSLAQALDPVERRPAVRRYEVLWLPLQDRALRLYRDETAAELTPGRQLASFVDDILVGNIALGGLLQAAWLVGGGRAIHEMWEFLLEQIPEDDQDTVDTWWEGLTGDRLFRGVSLEFGVQAERLQAALHAVERVVHDWDRDGRYTLDLPINLRWTASDQDTCMSAAHGRDTAWIDVTVSNYGPDHARGPFLAAIERVLLDHGGRPHLGKVHWENPRAAWDAQAWDHYWRVRDRFDPQERFMNAHLRALREGRDVQPGLPRQ